jgi:hypothetical protein
MPETRLPDLPDLIPMVIPPLLPLPKNLDTSLLISASTRWRENSQGLQALFAHVPSTRDTLQRLLTQQLDLDGTRVGLQFPATDQLAERFVTLTDACAFVFQHPVLEATLDQRCQVTGLNSSHALFGLAPRQLLERLKALAPERSLTERWNTYWDARAPGTPVSRRERANQLYLGHLEATAQMAIAQRTLSAEQLKPLLSVLDTAVNHAHHNGQPVLTEQVALVLSNQSKVKLPGSCIISVGGQQPVALLLYLPTRSVTMKAFIRRSDLEDWLTRQALVPVGLPGTGLRFEYGSRDLPLTTGMTELLALQLQIQVAALRNGTPGMSDLAEHGQQALAHADRVDQQRGSGAVFALPPSPDAEDTGNRIEDEPDLFGSLYADIPWSIRHAALNHHREALEALAGEDFNREAVRPFEDSLKVLEAAEQAADMATSALLYRARVLDLTTFNREFTALHRAHQSGLRAEAGIQRTLRQLSEDEFGLIQALLDTPDAVGSDRATASLVLTLSERNGERITKHTQELNGPIVITRPDALLDTASPHSLLLYWPGVGGGLQRFANRRDLERQVFKIDERNGVSTLQLKKITGDPLQYGLDRLTSEFEERAGEIRQRHTGASDTAQRADELEILRKSALATLQVPVNAARSLALAHLLEQDRSGLLASSLPAWLAKLPEAGRTRVKALIEAYLMAMRRSHERLADDLAPRDDFTRRHLQARLRKDFSIKGAFEVQIDLPDSVKLQKQLSSGSTPTTPQKLVAVPSATRSKMSLEELAQLNIDNTPSMQLEPFSLRLGFMQVEVTTTDDSERRILTAGITHAYLRKTLPELDLPKAYEKLIYDTFMGTSSEPLFTREHRRECLIEPWRLMLKLQGECARLQKQINHDELQVLNIAIDADTAAAWQAQGKRIVILPAYLSAGGKDTPNEGPVTLSGVTFIQEQVSGMTLLYLPDRPDGQFLRRYSTLEDARKALFNLCLRSEMVSYLAGRALLGNVRAHESRINQAVLKHFDAMIGVGVRWPATTSLASHLLNAHMGRLIEAHRGTSRSNDALYMERYALEGPRAFNYMKMALGLVPFVGTVLALYDAWTDANRAVAAFLRGDVGDGLTEVESMLLSLIDAAMDLLPGETATSALSRTARSLTRTRQLRKLINSGAIQVPSMRHARHVVARFAGYEYEQPISLTGLQPASHGIYRNIYRHADGDFVVRQGRIFQVEHSKDSRNWRLSGNRQKTYKQPIALDESGQWDTWYGVYGTTFEGGGIGGGAVLGHMADVLDPIWPQAIRQRLPRWWADQTFRRHHQLTEAADDLATRLNAQVSASNAAINRYNDSTVDNRPALRPAAEAACIGDIEMATRHYQTLTDLLPLTHGNKRRALIEMQSNNALLLTDRFQQRVYYANHRVAPFVDRIDDLTERLDDLAQDSLRQRLSTLEEIRKLRVDLLHELDQIETAMRNLNLWYERIAIRSDKAKVMSEVANLNGRLSEANLLYLRTGHLLEIVKRWDGAGDVSWFYLQNQADNLRGKVDRALFTQFSLAEVSATKVQRNQILQNCLDLYIEFRRDMKVWITSYPQHFHLDAVPPLMTGIEQMAERARKGVELPASPTTPTPAGQSNKRVFTTQDDKLLIGVERWEPTTQKRQFTMTGRGGYLEIWEQGSDGKFRLLNPRPPATAPIQRNLKALVKDARQCLEDLPGFQAKVRSYAEHDMSPVNLEHMMASKAKDLSDRALRIEEIEAQNTIIQQLRDRATELRSIGREMRTRQSLSTKNPTDGMLEDLVSHNLVQIRKTSPIKNLGKRKDGRIDYMQRYEVWDLTQTPAKVLWVAHFHYASATPMFRQFEKAHLKLPEHEHLTHADDASLPDADISRRSSTLIYFENL